MVFTFVNLISKRNSQVNFGRTQITPQKIFFKIKLLYIKKSCIFSVLNN